MADKLGVKLVSQEEVLKKADIISIHLPATDETKHLINQETLNKMKDGVYVVTGKKLRRIMYSVGRSVKNRKSSWICIGCI